MILKLNGNNLPIPDEDIDIDNIEISKSDRTANGRFVKEIVDNKKQITLTYDGLLPDDALIFINAFESGDSSILEYEDVTGHQTKEVYITSLPRKIYNPKPQYTKDITITMEEV